MNTKCKVLRVTIYYKNHRFYGLIGYEPYKHYIYQVKHRLYQLVKFVMTTRPKQPLLAEASIKIEASEVAKMRTEARADLIKHEKRTQLHIRGNNFIHWDKNITQHLIRCRAGISNTEKPDPNDLLQVNHHRKVLVVLKKRINKKPTDWRLIESWQSIRTKAFSSISRAQTLSSGIWRLKLV